MIAEGDLAGRPPLGRQTLRVRVWRHGDGPFNASLVVAVALVVGLLVVCAAVLWMDSALSREAFGLQFLVTTVWDPVAQVFGALPFIYGTLITSALALVIAVPIGLASAIALAELAPRRVAAPMGLLVELLAAVPSVIFGLWGLFVLIPVVVKPLGLVLEDTLGFLPIFAGPMFGPSRLAAGLVLAIMIVPTITAISRDVFRAIPDDQREPIGTGCYWWESIRKVLLSYGASGFAGASSSRWRERSARRSR